MAEASGEDLDTGGEGEVLVAATDGEGTEFLWSGFVMVAFAFDENDDSWLVVTVRGARWAPILVFEVPAVDIATGERAGLNLRLALVRIGAHLLTPFSLVPPYGARIPGRWARGDVKPDPEELTRFALAFSAGDSSFGFEGGFPDEFVSPDEDGGAAGRGRVRGRGRAV